MDQYKVPDPWREGRIGPTDQQPQPQPQHPDFVQRPGPPHTEDRSRGCGCSCATLMFLLVLVAGAGVFFLYFNNSEYIGKVQQIISEVRTAAVGLNLSNHPAIPTGDLNGDGSQDLVVLDYTIGNSETEPHAVALSGSDGMPLWSTSLAGDGNIRHLLAADDRILAIENKKISSIEPRSGAIKWTSELPDEVAMRYRQLSVFLAEGVVVVQTVDNNLTGLDLSSGEVRWQHLLPNPYPSTLQRLNDAICVQQERDKLRQIECLNLVSGAPLAPIDLGSWPDQANGLIVPSTSGEPVILRLWSDVSSPRLEQIAQDGSLIWQQTLEDMPDITNHLLGLGSDLQALAGGNHVVLSEREMLLLFDMSGASAPIAVQLPDTQLYPIALDGSLLYAAAVRQRGTKLLSVVGIDLKSGQVRWQTETLGSASGIFELNPDNWRYISDEGLLVAWMQKDRETSVGLINSRGVMRWQRTLQTNSLIDPARMGVGDGVVYVSELRFLAALDLRTGTVRWTIGGKLR